MKVNRGLAALLGGVGLAALAGAAPPDAGPDFEAVERGELLFRIHCAACHGAGGTGDGPMAESLHRRPADLTRLAAEAGGAFPAERAYRAIDGREPVGGHGSREMPIWGLSFQEGGRDDDQEKEVRGRILDLVAFLESLQPAADDSSAGD